MAYLDGKGKFDSKKWIRKNPVRGVDKSSVTSRTWNPTYVFLKHLIVKSLASLVFARLN